MDLEEIKKYLKDTLTEKRYMHSVGTMKKAKELAEFYGEDEGKAEFAGLVHDMAKELTKEQIDEYIRKYNVIVDDVEKMKPSLLHAKLRSNYGKRKI